MGIKRYKPVTPSMRFRTASDYSEITASKPEKSLTPSEQALVVAVTIKVAARQSIPLAGGNKTMYRVIDFKRNKDGVPGKVATIEYDPNRSARIALIHYLDGEKRYILWPVGLQGRRYDCSPGEDIDIKPGQCASFTCYPGWYPDP